MSESVPPAPRKWVRMTWIFGGLFGFALAASLLRLVMNIMNTSLSSEHPWADFAAVANLYVKQHMSWTTSVSPSVSCAREGPLRIHGQVHQRSKSDPPPLKFAVDEECLCSRLLQTTPSDDSVFLFEVLRLHCAGYDFQDIEPSVRHRTLRVFLFFSMLLK